MALRRISTRHPTPARGSGRRIFPAADDRHPAACTLGKGAEAVSDWMRAAPGSWAKAGETIKAAESAMIERYLRTDVETEDRLRKQLDLPLRDKP